MSSGTTRSKKRSLDIPAELESAFDSISIHTEKLAQLGKTSSLPTHCKHYISPPVSLLPDSCSPHDIIRIITTIIVNSFNAPRRLSNPHILKELIEFHPPITNGDAPSSITGEAGTVRIKATIPHPLPNSIKSCGVGPGTSVFQKKAAAGFCVSRGKIGVSNDCFFSTIASTDTTGFLPRGCARRRCGSDYNKSSKSATDDIYFGRHNGGLALFMFSGGRPASTGARYDSYQGRVAQSIS